MINTKTETLIQFCKLPKHLSPMLGKRVSLSTLHRWRLKGKQCVKLETIMVGGARYSSEEALNRFFNRVTAAVDGETMVAIPSTGAKQAHAQLSQMGI